MAAGLALSMGAAAAASPRFDIAAGPLAEAIGSFGTQSGSTVGITGSLAGLRGRAVHGRLPPRRALRRLLEGTGLHVEVIDPTTFRINRPAQPPSKRPEPAAMSNAATRGDEIVVIASKRGTRIGDYAGSVTIVDAGSNAFARTAFSGTEALVDSVASLTSTNLGPGRNKLIVRGVADSSFSGPSQAIVGEYLGDIRLNYNAPDPDLHLYDMERIEVLEGPQGTLYGAGSLGGIVRLLPAPPDPGGWSASASAGWLTTRHGDDSSDISAMVNVPVVPGRVALRLVGYRHIAGGFIDDVGRGLTDVNRSTTKGGRAVMRARVGDGWIVDLGGLVQNIDSRDGQFAERGLPPYTRASAIAQPFDNDYKLAHVSVARHDGRTSFVSATGFVDHDVAERFDGTGAAGPLRAFDQQNHIRLLTNETRISRHGEDGSGWLAGISLIRNSERLTRALGPIDHPARIAGLRNNLTGAALYGESTIGIAGRLQATIGGRLSYAHLTGTLLDLPRPGKEEANRDELSVLPLISLSFRPTGSLTIYARYEEGYRGGGLSVAAKDMMVVSQRFIGDSIATFESGVRLGDPSRSRFSAGLVLSYAHWEHIQADLVDTTGLPYTTNVGNGRIAGLELQGRWHPSAAFAIDAGLFVNDSDLSRPAIAFAGFRHAELPDVARVGARGSLSWRRPIHGDTALTADLAIRYFGHSRLGIGTGLDFLQGDYTDTSLGIRIGTDRLGASLDMTNILDSGYNRFSFGNPFGVMLGRQITPQRPRSIRLGLDGRF